MESIWGWLVWFWEVRLADDSFRADLLWGLATVAVFVFIVLTWYVQASVAQRNRQRVRRGSRRQIQREVRQHLAKDLYHIPTAYRR